MPLVEIVRGDRTGPRMSPPCATCWRDAARRRWWSKKNRPGQLGNRLQMALVREAAYMIRPGSRTRRTSTTPSGPAFGMRFPVYGLLEHVDIVGFEIAFSVVDYVARDLCNEPHGPESCAP